MTSPVQENQVQEQKSNDKELNFRMLEAKHEKQLQYERAEKAELQRQLNERNQRKEDPEDDSEPFVDHKKLERKLAKFGEQTKQQTQSDINTAVQHALREERKQNWVKSNPDFYDVLKHSEKLAQQDPDLAESILDMPEGFERQKLVYKNIKALGLHKDKPKESTIQEKIDANRRSPYYQPSGVGTAPYQTQGDYSPQGKKQAYDKMQELKSRLRI